ncbi:NB-ARC domain-containing protein [Actinoplanes sp. NPDC049802]|uniref:NB-ARC domain-containing protein n=1 Tax=Actinoplanes sp. NPDC049802 TaxID=3154742 RepID=UPI0033D01AFB
MLEVLAAEAVRVMTPGVAAATGYGARRILRLVRGRSSRPPSDRAALQAWILRQAREDETFAAQLAQELVAVDTVDAIAVLAPAMFADRAEIRERIQGPGLWVIAGARGSGKTALARQVAYDLRDRVNACAEVDLDGFRDGESLRLIEVQQAVLRQLGVPHVDDTAPVVGDQYRRALRHRKFTLVLDNVIGEGEANALAHPWEHATVLVTTRVLGQDLRVWNTGDTIVLAGVDDDGAREILAARCGEAMLAAEPRATRELIRLCDGLPTVLAQAGARLARRHGRPDAVAELAEQLTGAQGPLVDDLIRRSVAELPVDGLEFVVGHPGTDITDAGVSALLGRPGDDLVDALIDAALMFRGPGGRLSLLWSVRRSVTADDTGFLRFLGWFRDMAGAADLAMDPAGVTDRARHGRLRRYPAPPELPWPERRLRPADWLQNEAHIVLDLLREAHHRGHHVEVVQICGALEALLTVRGHHLVCLAANEWGIASAEALGWRPAAARLHALQGRIQMLLGHLDRADVSLSTAEALVAPLGDRQLESSILEFRSRWAQESARAGAAGQLALAETGLRTAVAIDRELGDGRALGLHLRMLANVLVDAGRGGEVLALLADATAPAGDTRNLARLHLVRARAHLALRDAAAAAEDLRRARELTTGSGATQYELELADLRAQVALAYGDVEQARRWWGWVAYRYFLAEHPRQREFTDRLSGLPPTP